MRNGTTAMMPMNGTNTLPFLQTFGGDFIFMAMFGLRDNYPPKFLCCQIFINKKDLATP